MKKKHKYIFVVGGVMSGVGKGIATSSLGKILQAKGFKVNAVKIDPYLNVDAGTMNPTEHGEVFVLDSGMECDQDMGNYERFMGLNLSSEDYMTSGGVYKSVIDRERALGYKGKCVEAIPHITNEIIKRLEKAAETHASDISLIEIGGTIGDYQNILFIEAARVLRIKNPNDVVFVMVSYLPIPGKLGEMKSRPTQHAVRTLNSYGVQPDFIVARAEHVLDQKRKEKIAFATSVPESHIISAPDIESIYDIPLNFEKDKFASLVIGALHLKGKSSKNGLEEWKKFVDSSKNSKKTVKIGIVGKYFDTGDYILSDAYLSVIEAVKFSSFAHGAKPEIKWINAKDIESGTTPVESLAEYDGILVPGGFGESGIEGKIKAIKYARENKIPYFGLCYGMQLMVIEYARNILNLADANTTEINPTTTNPIIDIMPDQKKKLAEGNYGGSMRLGAYKAVVKEGTIANESYNATEISERHRHRFEVNPEYVKMISEAGLVFSATSPDGVLMEIAELPKSKHPFFLGTQFHPEFKAWPLAPHPLFSEFIGASLKKGKKGN